MSNYVLVFQLALLEIEVLGDNNPQFGESEVEFPHSGTSREGSPHPGPSGGSPSRTELSHGFTTIAGLSPRGQPQSSTMYSGYSPQDGQSRMPRRLATPPRPTTPPNQTVKNRKRRLQDINNALNEEMMETLRTVGQTTSNLIDQLSTPGDLYDGIRQTAKNWTPERQRRIEVRIRRMVADEEDDRFQQGFGYRA